MPLFDHFRPPVTGQMPWETLHSALIGMLVVQLNRVLPAEFVALDTIRFGPRLEIDVATLEKGTPEESHSHNGGGTAVAAAPQVWTPPVAMATVSTSFPDASEIKVYLNDGSRQIVGAIELISPANKDRPDERRAFAAKVLGYLQVGISVVILDVVTTRRANLHNAIARLVEWPSEVEMPAGTGLYAAAYRPVLRDNQPEVDLWTESIRLGESLPTMPLRLTGDTFVPVDFESAYMEACRTRKLL